MHRTDASNNIVSEPSATAAGTAGFYRQSGPPWTTSDPEHLNAMQEELVAVATIKGASLSKANRGQCAEALAAIKAIEGEDSGLGDGVTAVSTDDVAAAIASTTVTIDTGGVAIASGSADIAGSSVAAASLDATADGTRTAVIAADDANTTGGTNSAVIAADGNNTDGANGTATACLATSGCISDGQRCANVASALSTAGGASTSNQCANIASVSCVVADDSFNGSQCANIASNGCSNDAASQAAIIASLDSNLPNTGPTDCVTLLSSKDVTSHGSAQDGDVMGGYNASAGGIKWRIQGSDGQYFGYASYTGSGVDYAEMFPNLDGEAHAPGRLLTRRGRGCRLAQPGDRVLGIVSVAPAVVGGADAGGWYGQHKRDEWGALVRDADGCLVANPDYDPEREQIERRKRPDEWTCVGLVGQLRIAIDDTVSAETEFIAPGADGIGTHSDEESRGACVELMEIEQPFDAARGYGIALVFIR